MQIIGKSWSKMKALAFLLTKRSAFSRSFTAFHPRPKKCTARDWDSQSPRHWSSCCAGELKCARRWEKEAASKSFCRGRLTAHAHRRVERSADREHLRLVAVS